MKPQKKVVEYRSGLEEAFRTLVDREKLTIGYEDTKLRYVTSPAKRVYLPDWTVAPNVYVETKGYFDYDNRCKAIYIRDQHPEVKLLYVFQKSNKTIAKDSKTTYGDWCSKNGIEWCDFKDTDFWLNWIKQHQEGNTHHGLPAPTGTGESATTQSGSVPKRARRSRKEVPANAAGELHGH